MELVLTIALVSSVIVIVWLILSRSRSTADERRVEQNEKLPGIRREAAQQRHLPKQHSKTFTREVIAGQRRFFFDVEEGQRGKFLRISELERHKGKPEEAFTIIVFAKEIKGFHKAMTDALYAIEN